MFIRVTEVIRSGYYKEEMEIIINSHYIVSVHSMGKEGSMLYLRHGISVEYPEKPYCIYVAESLDELYNMLNGIEG